MLRAQLHMVLKGFKLRRPGNINNNSYKLIQMRPIFAKMVVLETMKRGKNEKDFSIIEFGIYLIIKKPDH